MSYQPGILIHFKTVGEQHFAVISDGGIYREISLDDQASFLMWAESIRQIGLATPEKAGTYEYYQRSAK
jgi:hypothetical protein